MKGSKDQEFVQLRNRFFIGLFVVCIVGAIVTLFLFQRFRFGLGVSSKMNRKDTFLIYVDSYQCENCVEVKKILDQKNVEYETMKVDSPEAQNFFDKYEIVDHGEVVPAVIYIKDGKVYSTMFQISNFDELELFLKNYRLSK